jgi:pentose-5-phosphate-3-epimerase
MENKKNKKQIEIVAALLPENFEHLKNEVEHVQKAVKWVQIDIVDGKFAPTKTWPYNQRDFENWQKLIDQEIGLPVWEKINFEIDMMVLDQIGAAKDWISVGASRVIGHIEAFNKNNFGEEFILDEEKLSEFFALRDDFNVELVMSLNPSTDNSALDSFIDKLDGVQFMGNDRIGYHGVELDEKVLTKISDLRKKMPNLPIGIDIGVNFETLEKLRDAGVTRFSSGSLILKSLTPKETVLEMLDIVENSF